MKLAEIVKNKREKIGITQAELANLANISVAAIRQIEQGRRPDPQWSTVQMIAAGLGIKCDELTEKKARGR